MFVIYYIIYYTIIFEFTIQDGGLFVDVCTGLSLIFDLKCFNLSIFIAYIKCYIKSFNVVFVGAFGQKALSKRRKRHILIYFIYLCCYKTLWIPGTDVPFGGVDYIDDSSESDHEITVLCHWPQRPDLYAGTAPGLLGNQGPTLRLFWRGMSHGLLFSFFFL